MESALITKTGKIKSQFLPAIYLDSSVLIDYWMAEGMELPESEVDELIKKNETPHLQVVRDLLKSETRINKVIEIRKKLLYEEVKTNLVVSPLSLLELMEWNAEAAFKQIASEASGAISVQKRSKKQIADYLKKALELRKTEIKERPKKQGEIISTGLEILMMETWLNSSFAKAHGLRGLLEVDIVNFDLSFGGTWKSSSAYAYLQLGIADIMHILLAQHLGCKYIASFDSDFARARNVIQEETEILVLNSPEEILNIL